LNITPKGRRGLIKGSNKADRRLKKTMKEDGSEEKLHLGEH
jgi:hypothetical protein